MTEIGWRRLTKIALDLYDVAHLLGPDFTFVEWRRQFSPHSSREAALRTWERVKSGFRLLDIEFKTGEYGNQHAEISLSFESEKYMFDKVDELIGGAEYAAKYPQNHLSEEEVRAAIEAVHSERGLGPASERSGTVGARPLTRYFAGNGVTNQRCGGGTRRRTRT